MSCPHADQIDLPLPGEDDKAGAACLACVARGDTWVHLRQCRTSGHVGCCDSSPNRHARAHAREAEHPIIASFEPDEAWSYCYVDAEMLD